MDDRFARQQLLIPDGMRQATVVLVGLGMLGSWTAHALARTCRRVLAFDFDTVGRENIGTQAYDMVDVGIPKATAMLDNLVGLPFEAVNVRFGDGEYATFPRDGGPLVVVSAVDSFAGRKMVAQWSWDNNADLFIDTRAHGVVGVVIVCPNLGGPTENKPNYSDEPLATYLATLESDETAPHPQCGAEGTAFVGLWVASQVASSISRHFRGLPVPAKVVRDVGMDIELAREDALLCV